MELVRRNFVKSLLATVASGFTMTSNADSSIKDHLVEISGAAFLPAKLLIKVGDSVTWINKDIVPHTATAVDGSWDTGFIGSGEERRVVFDGEKGSAYICTYHPSMTAVLEFD